MNRFNRPSLERLETRDTPASVLFAGGSLVVLGDFLADNDVRFDSASPGVVTATVNGQSQTFSGVSNLISVTGRGADDLQNNTPLPMTAFLGDGDDSVIGGTGNDVLYGQGGSDVIYDLLGSNTIFANDRGFDRVYTNAQSVAFVDAQDLLVTFFRPGRTPGSPFVGLEPDGILYITPGNADSSVSIDAVGTSVVVTYNFGQGLLTRSFARSDIKGISYFGGGGNDLYVNNTDIEEAAYGSAGNDQLFGGFGAFNLLKGSGGNDVLIARGQRADLSGNGGADVLASLAPINTVRADGLDVINTPPGARLV